MLIQHTKEYFAGDHESSHHAAKCAHTVYLYRAEAFIALYNPKARYNNLCVVVRLYTTPARVKIEYNLLFF